MLLSLFGSIRTTIGQQLWASYGASDHLIALRQGKSTLWQGIICRSNSPCGKKHLRTDNLNISCHLQPSTFFHGFLRWLTTGQTTTWNMSTFLWTGAESEVVIGTAREGKRRLSKVPRFLLKLFQGVEFLSKWKQWKQGRAAILAGYIIHWYLYWYLYIYMWLYTYLFKIWLYLI